MSLAQQLIEEHHRRPHHRGLTALLDAEARQVNPVCGDEVTVRVLVRHGRVADLAWDGRGCSLSQASTSMMADLVVGQPVGTAAARADAVRRLIDRVGAAGATQAEEDELEDAVALVGVARFPSRVRCALLGWTAWQDATARALGPDRAAAAGPDLALGSDAAAVAGVPEPAP